MAEAPVKYRFRRVVSVWQRRSGKTGIGQDHLVVRISIARSVCHHQHCCHDHYEDDYRGGGMFAPGHLGELTQVIPFDEVDGALANVRAVQRRLLLLSTVFVFGCTFRALLPRANVQRLCLVDSWLSSVLVGR